MVSEVRIIDRIENWLKEEGIQYNRISEPESDVALSFWPDPGLKLTASVKGDRLEVSAHVLLTDKHWSNPQYFNGLDLALHQQLADFQFSFTEKNQPVGIKIHRRIWSESLSKTSFYDSVTSVKHSTYIVVINQRQLSVNGT